MKGPKEKENKGWSQRGNGKANPRCRRSPVRRIRTFTARAMRPSRPFRPSCSSATVPVFSLPPGPPYQSIYVLRPPTALVPSLFFFSFLLLFSLSILSHLPSCSAPSAHPVRKVDPQRIFVLVVPCSFLFLGLRSSSLIYRCCPVAHAYSCSSCYFLFSSSHPTPCFSFLVHLHLLSLFSHSHSFLVFVILFFFSFSLLLPQSPSIPRTGFFSFCFCHTHFTCLETTRSLIYALSTHFSLALHGLAVLSRHRLLKKGPSFLFWTSIFCIYYPLHTTTVRLAFFFRSATACFCCISTVLRRARNRTRQDKERPETDIVFFSPGGSV